MGARFLQTSDECRGTRQGRGPRGDYASFKAPPPPDPQRQGAIPSIVSTAFRDFLIQINFLPCYLRFWHLVRSFFWASFIYFFHSKTQGEPRGAPLWADGQVRMRECLKRGQWGRESPSLPQPRTAPWGACLGSPSLVGEPPVSVPYPLRPLWRTPSSVGALGSPQGPAAAFSMPPLRPGYPFGPGCARPPCELRPSGACPLEVARTSLGGASGLARGLPLGSPGITE